MTPADAALKRARTIDPERLTRREILALAREVERRRAIETQLRKVCAEEATSDGVFVLRIDVLRALDGEG